MSKHIFVVGHKNPDTDSICSAIAYAGLKQNQGLTVKPYRAGNINRETRFVLDYFKVDEPEFLADLHIRVKDLLDGENVVIGPEMPLREAWMLMRAKKIKTLPVVDKGRHLLGLVTSGDLADKYLAELGGYVHTELAAASEKLVKTLSDLTSMPVSSIMKTSDLVHFHDDDLLEEVKKVMLESRFRNYPVVDEQHRIVGEISRYHLLGYSKKKVILVDHNEFSQSVDGAQKAEVIEVVDHHRVGGIQTGEPIMFRNEPVGSTCTLVAKAYFEHGVELKPEIAGILCAGILSDTVVFKSPTCTQTDRNVAERLAGIAGINPVEFGVAMFKEGSFLSGSTPADILNTDFKEFEMGDLQIGIGQVSVMSTDEVKALKNLLFTEMESTRKARRLDYVLLMVSDLLQESTDLFINGSEPEEIGKAFGVEVEANSAYLPGVLSRKKQVVPPLMKYFTK
jgi:manganese-dependent inorganic pyrophosphatase